MLHSDRYSNHSPDSRSTDNSSYDNYAIIVYNGDISMLHSDIYRNHSPDSRSTDNSSYDNYAIIVYNGDIKVIWR